jgi:hypothetical protein
MVVHVVKQTASARVPASLAFSVKDAKLEIAVFRKSTRMLV